MARANAFLDLVARELGSEDSELISLTAFLALYTRVDEGALVLDPVDRELRKELGFVIEKGLPRPSIGRSAKSGGEAFSDEIVERVRASCLLVKKLGIEKVKEVVSRLLGDPPDGVEVEPLVERIVEVSRDVDRFLDEVSSYLGVESLEAESAT